MTDVVSSVVIAVVMMKSLMKVLLLIALVCACVSFAEERKEPLYSSFECEGYNKEDPEDLSMRNCILHNVVLASENGQPIMLFYARDGQETPLLGANKDADRGRIVEIAPHMFASVKIVRSALPDDIEPVQDTAVLMTGQSNGFAQFVFDTLYSIYWMLGKTGDIDPTTGLVRNPDAVTIVEVGRPNDYTKITQGSISGKSPAPLRYLKGVLYSRVVVGPAGHLVLSYVKGSKKTVEPEKDLFEAYRSFFIKVAQVKEEDFIESRIIVSQRFTNLKLLNGEDLVSELSYLGSVQVAFLSQLPIKSQIDLVSGCGVFLSMHCDDMAYMLFLRSGTSVVEMFPYGVESDVYKKLAALCGLKYYAWHNTDRSKAVFDKKILEKYPLTDEQKKKIIDAEKYDASLPSGALAYWENQDTKVNLDEVVAIVKDIVPPKPAEDKEEPEKEEL